MLFAATRESNFHLPNAGALVARGLSLGALVASRRQLPVSLAATVPPSWGMSCLVASLLTVGASTDRRLLPDLSLAELASRRAQLAAAKTSSTPGGKRSNGRQTNLEKIDSTHFAIFWAYDGFKGESPVGIFPAPPKVKTASTDGGGDGGGGDGGGREPSRPAPAPAKSIDKVAAAGSGDKLFCGLGYVAANSMGDDAWCAENCGASNGCLGDAREVCMCDSKFLHTERERQQQEAQEEAQQQQAQQEQAQQEQPQLERQQEAQPEEPLMASYWPPPSSPELPPPTPPPMPSSPPSPPPPPLPPSPPPGTPAPVPKMPTWGDTAEEDCPRFCFHRPKKDWVKDRPAYCSYVPGCKKCWACGPQVAKDAYSAATDCWRDSVCRCKIFAECEGNHPDDTTTQATTEYPRHKGEFYCYKYALCGDDLPKHLRGSDWEEGGARAPAQKAIAAPRLLSSSIPRSPPEELPRHSPAEDTAPELPDLRVASQNQGQLQGLQHSIRTAAAVTFAARIIFSNPQMTELEDARLLKCADFPDEQRCESGHTLPKVLYPGKLYVVQNQDFDFSELDSLSRLIGEAASTASRGDLLEHSRGNNFRFVAPAPLEAAGIKHALYMDGDTCIADVAGVSRWMRSPVESAAEAAKRHVGLTDADNINFEDEFVLKTAWKPVSGSDYEPDSDKKFEAFNAGVMLLHLDELKKVDTIARMQHVLQTQISRRANKERLLWENSVNQAPAIIAMYNYTKLVDEGFNCRLHDVAQKYDLIPSDTVCKIWHSDGCWRQEGVQELEAATMETADHVFELVDAEAKPKAGTGTMPAQDWDSIGDRYDDRGQWIQPSEENGVWVAKATPTPKPTPEPTPTEAPAPAPEEAPAPKSISALKPQPTPLPGDGNPRPTPQTGDGHIGDDGQWVPPLKGAGLEGIDYSPVDTENEVMRKCAHPPCAPVFGRIGDDCFKPCGGKAGKCFDAAKGQGFCGRPSTQPGAWSGSCCKLDADKGEQSSDCDNRGCIGFHCCVEDYS